ncbi:carboxymuconolactone decarboxylase family protein [Amycolatopsis acidicola]|uniref:Carboxymuconolactone decarboxylase family protein n=1 Tax=Amycolatopsis acidicola TaxID=2596893 RepID=A0A5N0VEM6_9PSEU|nr:carboxymuconolactone decarboxylase family protein [Amycolatopsis acidicola]KAA9163610.1 carboxymuconolactone decarboxylase family protein [Amycolatopsis acidicola]
MTAEVDPNPAESPLTGIARGEAPVLEQLVAMNLDSLARSGMPADTYFLVRLAALIAMDAPPASYLVSLGLAADSGVTAERVQSVFVALAPVVGSARITAAAGNVLRALGIAGAADS